MQSHWSENDLVVNGALKHYVRTGGQGKPALVLVHGFSDNGLCWQMQAAELENEYDLLMPDAIGHGLSARVARDQETDMTADLAEFIRAQGVERPIVGGHSMGGSVAGQLGARYPGSLRALILEDPAWGFDETPSAEPRRIFGEDSPTGRWLKELQAISLEEVIARSHAEHPTWPEGYLRPWCSGKQQLDLNFLTTLDHSWGNWRTIARSLACPTLLITADPVKGGIITPQVAQEVCSMNPNIRVVNIPGVGHHIRFEAHAAYMQAVRQFLADLDHAGN